MITNYVYEDGKERPVAVFLENGGYIQYIEIDPWDVKQWDERVDHPTSSQPS
jgi:hypothetical protein